MPKKDDDGGKILSFTRRIEERIMRYNQEVGFSATPKDEEILDLVRMLQNEFQRAHCPSCTRYDPRTCGYREIGHLNDPTDCRHHWTDLLGRCWNHETREQTATAREGEEENYVADQQLLELLLQSIRPI